MHRNIMYDAGIGEQGRRNAKQRSYLFDCGSEEHKVPTTCVFAVAVSSMFALGRLIEKGST